MYFNETILIYSTDMFCYQCEQAKLNKHCTEIGVCGKTPEVQRMQDLLMFALKVKRNSCVMHYMSPERYYIYMYIYIYTFSGII